MPSDGDSAREKILQLISEVAAAEVNRRRLRLLADTKASAVPGWDSLVHTRILLEVEDRLGITVDIARTYEFECLGELADYLVALIAVAGDDGSAK